MAYLSLFAQEFPGFSAESPFSQESPLSPENQDGWSSENMVSHQGRFCPSGAFSTCCGCFWCHNQGGVLLASLESGHMQTGQSLNKEPPGPNLESGHMQTGQSLNKELPGPKCHCRSSLTYNRAAS